MLTESVPLEVTVDLCISDPLIIDPATFSLWLEGLSVQQVHQADLYPEMPSELVLAEVHEQFRLFRLLGPALKAGSLAQCRYRIELPMCMRPAKPTALSHTATRYPTLSGSSF